MMKGAKFKNGNSFTRNELKSRLHQMEIDFNPGIVDKKVLVKWYEDALLVEGNREKIKERWMRDNDGIGWVKKLPSERNEGRDEIINDIWNRDVKGRQMESIDDISGNRIELKGRDESRKINTNTNTNTNTEYSRNYGCSDTNASRSEKTIFIGNRRNHPVTDSGKDKNDGDDDDIHNQSKSNNNNNNNINIRNYSDNIGTRNYNPINEESNKYYGNYPNPFNQGNSNNYIYDEYINTTNNPNINTQHDKNANTNSNSNTLSINYRDPFRGHHADMKQIHEIISSSSNNNNNISSSNHNKNNISSNPNNEYHNYRNQPHNIPAHHNFPDIEMDMNCKPNNDKQMNKLQKVENILIEGSPSQKKKHFSISSKAISINQSNRNPKDTHQIPEKLQSDHYQIRERDEVNTTRNNPNTTSDFGFANLPKPKLGIPPKEGYNSHRANNNEYEDFKRPLPTKNSYCSNNMKYSNDEGNIAVKNVDKSNNNVRNNSNSANIIHEEDNEYDNPNAREYNENEENTHNEEDEQEKAWNDQYYQYHEQMNNGKEQAYPKQDNYIQSHCRDNVQYHNHTTTIPVVNTTNANDFNTIRQANRGDKPLITDAEHSRRGIKATNYPDGKSNPSKFPGVNDRISPFTILQYAITGAALIGGIYYILRNNWISSPTISFTWNPFTIIITLLKIWGYSLFKKYLPVTIMLCVLSALSALIMKNIKKKRLINKIFEEIKTKLIELSSRRNTASVEDSRISEDSFYSERGLPENEIIVSFAMRYNIPISEFQRDYFSEILKLRRLNKNIKLYEGMYKGRKQLFWEWVR